MEITGIRIKLSNDGNVRAYASIMIDGCFLVKGLAIFERPKGFFVSMPGRRTSNGVMRNFCYTLNKQTEKMIQDRVIAAFEAEIKKLENADGTLLHQ
ncbi:MAG: SpoVG family protein [Chitinispirillales bacterium]|jgi:stage V sporulation protein G|nr:SpoVG family protein [Chitinispirillales bacterium]